MMVRDLSKEIEKFRVHLIGDTRGTHVHVRVFVNGGLAGNLILREEEWAILTRVLDLGMAKIGRDLEITKDGEKKPWLHEWYGIPI